MIRTPESTSTTNTFFLGPQGLLPQIEREIHYNDSLRMAVDQEAGKWDQSLDFPVQKGDKYLWSHKWPKSEANSHAGYETTQAVQPNECALFFEAFSLLPTRSWSNSSS